MALSAAGGIARGLSEFVPLDYANEAAGAQGRRARRARRDRCDARGLDLLDGRRRRAASGGFAAGWHFAGNGVRSAAVRFVWAEKCVRRAAAAFWARRRGTQSGG